MLRTYSSELQVSLNGRPEKRKASSSDNAWSCEIAGCNKTFAREADLRRHQRTTKAHAVPESKSVHLCPHCNSSFTRMDALKRHQNGRHNGITEAPLTGQHNSRDSQQTPESAGPSSRSRVGSSSTDEAAGATSDVATLAATSSIVHALPEVVGPGSGPQSYFRQHALDAIFIHSANSMPEPTGFQSNRRAGFDGSANIVPPSSHSRNWPPEPPWIQEALGKPRSTPGLYYQSDSVYRTANGELALPGPIIAGKCPLGEDGSTVRLRSSDATKGTSMDENNKSELLSRSPSTSTVSVEDLQSVPQRTPSPIPATDRTGMNAAVERALQAMLAIDPSLGSISSMQSPVDEHGGLSSPVSFQELHNAVASLTRFDSSMAHGDEANMSEGFGVSGSEGRTPMLRPEEILNEDPSIYS